MNNLSTKALCIIVAIISLAILLVIPAAVNFTADPIGLLTRYVKISDYAFFALSTIVGFLLSHINATAKADKDVADASLQQQSVTVAPTIPAQAGSLQPGD